MAQPTAPINSGVLLRITRRPVRSSNARTMESFFIVPPCTTMWSPSMAVSVRRNTLNRQFFTTE